MPMNDSTTGERYVAGLTPRGDLLLEVAGCRRPRYPSGFLKRFLGFSYRIYIIIDLTYDLG
jgi:hypothetical protein